MVKIDESIKKKYYDYLSHHRICEIIDSAIFEKFGNKYLLVDTEAPFHTNHPNKKIVEADLVYVSEDRNSVILIEETSDPTNKKEQLLGYGKITHEALRLLTKSDIPPSLDVFLVFPRNKRTGALSIYTEIEESLPKLGTTRGISLWYYPESKNFLKNAGGKFSNSFPKDILQLNSKKIGTFKILKNSVSPVYLLQYIVIEAFSKYYGATKNGTEVEIDKNKLSEILTPYGVTNQTKWRESISIGKHVKWLKNVDINQFNFTIKFSKVSAVSIAGSKKLTSDFFNAIVEEQDLKQSSLHEFIEEELPEKTAFKEDIDEED